MLQGSVIAALVILVFACLLAMLFLWRQSGWFMQWLKGSLGFVMLFCAIILVFIAHDLWSYQAVTPGKVVANVSIYQLGDQSYDVTITDSNGQEYRSMVRGDQWQLDARLLRWQGPGASSNGVMLYRLEQTSGRFLQLEQQRTQEHAGLQLQRSRWVDTWRMLSNYPFWLVAEQGRVQFMPLVNGAVFAIHADIQGVVAHPVNDVAEHALQRGW